MLFMNRCLHFHIRSPHPTPSLLLRKQYLSLREQCLSQRDWNSSRSERGASSLNCKQPLGKGAHDWKGLTHSACGKRARTAASSRARQRIFTFGPASMVA